MRSGSGRRRMGYSRRVGVSHGLWDVNGDALRERNLLEATETGFLSSFFECKATFEAEGSNLRFKFVNRAASKEDYVLGCSLHRCVLLMGSSYRYSQVKHREGNMQWIYSILLDVQIFSSFSIDVWGNVRFNLIEGSIYVYIV